jgi:hypothetical protein
MRRRDMIFAFGAALSRARAEVVKVNGAAIEVRFAGEEPAVGRTALLEWVTRAGRAVSLYYGKFPVARTVVQLRASARSGNAIRATTYPEEPPISRIMLGRDVTEANLMEDWVMTHELVHLGFPSVPRRHHWIEEGIATYVEPIARAQAGQLDVKRVWREMVRDMPKGQPREGDQGLDHTHTWGRTYWGGAIFCLVADVRIRERTKNRYGLQHALRGILARRGSITSDWPVERALKVGDDATGVRVLSELYAAMKDSGEGVDLDELWRRLGVGIKSGAVEFKDDAPLANVRRAIVRVAA